MKLRKNRLVSLLLVLAMVLALVPAVLAATEDAASIELQETASLKVGENVTLTATVKDSNGNTVSDAEVEWFSGDAEKLEVTANGLVTAKAYVKDPVAVTAQVKGKTTVKAKCSVTISKGELSYTAQSISSPAKTGTEEAAVKAALTTAYSNLTFDNKDKLEAMTDAEWTRTETDYASTKGTTLHYTATLHLSADAAENYESATATINATVSFSDAPTIGDITCKVNDVTAAKPTLSVAKNASSGLKLSVAEPNKTPDGATLNYQWFKCSADGKVSGDALNSTSNKEYTLTSAQVSTAGTYYYLCRVTATDSTTELSTSKDSAVFTVTVNEPLRVVFNKYSGTNTVGQRVVYTATVQKFVNGAYVTATAGTDFKSVAFMPSSISMISVTTLNSASSITNVSVDLKAAGTTKLFAYVYKTSSLVTADATSSVDITISTATANTVTQNPTSSSYALMDETQMVNAVMTATRNSYTSTYATPVKFTLSAYNGSFSLNGSSSYATTYTAYTNATPRVSSVYFVPSTTYGFNNNYAYVTYTAYDAYNNPVATGTVKFTGASSINYNAMANTAVYFSSTDFQSFFKTALGNSTYANLTNVTFNAPYISSGTGTLGTLNYNSYTYGTFYTTYFANIPAANLGYVSYTPSSSLTKYTVSIPFTATGSYNTYGIATQTVSGIVTITVNDGHIIGMTGTSFQTAAVGTEIYTKYPGMSYVRFTLPQTTVGKLYYGYQSIANKGTAVSYTDNFYNIATTLVNSTQKSINSIYFVPAADCLSTVSIGYTAYNTANQAIGTGTITFTITKKTASTYFNDVTSTNTGNWSADAIDFLYANKVVTGKGYNTFAPKDNMTRGDFVLMLYRLAGTPSVAGISNPFTDVKATDYYYSAILWAYRNNIVTGVDSKTFAPKKNITREQIAATLYRMSGSPVTTSYITGYYDASKVHSYALSAMKWAVGNGYVTGSSGYLNPTNNATRAEVSTMLHRYLTK